MRTTTIATEELAQCPHCDSGAIHPWCRGRDRLLDVGEASFEYARCKACGLLFECVRPLEDEVYKAYPSYYGPYQAAPQSGSQKNHGIASRIIQAAIAPLNLAVRSLLPDPLPETIRQVYRPNGAGRTLLDFGCGSTQFLDRAKARGWNTVGMDFAESVVTEVGAAGHLAYVVRSHKIEEIPDDSLDAVRMNHVIEHLYHPKEVLTELSRKLRRGGRLHLATPNPTGLSARLFGAYWHGLDCPRHVMLWPPKLLSRLLQQIGFSKCEIRYEATTNDFARSWGYFLLEQGRVDRAGVDALKHDPLVGAMLYLPARLAAQTGFGDRYHLFVEK